jgi:FlaA1/EpsC-like NDP-sugar epimerase
LKLISRILSGRRDIKALLVYSIDISICFISTYISFFLRVGNFVNINYQFMYAFLISALSFSVIAIYFKFYQAIIRFFNELSVKFYLKVGIFYFFIYAIIIFSSSIDGLPRTLGVIQPLIFFPSVIILRFIMRRTIKIMLNSTGKIIKKNILIYGVGDYGQYLFKFFHKNPNYNIIGFIDESDIFNDGYIGGVKVYKSQDLKHIINFQIVDEIFLAVPYLNWRERNIIIKNLSFFKNIKIKTIPHLTDLISGRSSVADISDLKIEDVLERSSRSPNIILMQRNVKDKIVLITGAGGSIGSELCRQVIKIRPKALILFEHNEFSLYSINQELNQLSMHNNISSKIICILGSITSKDRIENVFKKFKPNTVFHAAAYKHVPLVEENICAGIENNVFGTLNLAHCAKKFEVHNFVLISSDKAVRPTNYMGASKRLSELILQAFNLLDNNKTIFSIVRFGNVLGSSGSVLPLFIKQIKEGGPITLTHKKVTRFFMTIPEAAELVIQASSISRKGGIFILDMGKALKIFDIAKRILKIYGLRLKDFNNPEGIEIKIIGLRPGEKLHEELQLSQNFRKTIHPRIIEAKEDFFKWSFLQKHLNLLQDAINGNDIRYVNIILKKLVEGFDSKKKII